LKKEIEVNLEQKPVLALTMGDPAGVGPEVCVKALADKNHYDICRPFVVGDKDVLEHALSMCPVTLKVQEITDPRKASYANGTINVFNLANLAPEQFKPGVVRRTRVGLPLSMWIRRFHLPWMAGWMPMSPVPSTKKL
jgi:4-hydroxythreonine-4-phosphate dehydrogenase